MDPAHVADALLVSWERCPLELRVRSADRRGF
jgi:hypothetical protein